MEGNRHISCEEYFQIGLCRYLTFKDVKYNLPFLKCEMLIVPSFQIVQCENMESLEWGNLITTSASWPDLKSTVMVHETVCTLGRMSQEQNCNSLWTCSQKHSFNYRKNWDKSQLKDILKPWPKSLNIVKDIRTKNVREIATAKRKWRKQYVMWDSAWDSGTGKI